MILYLDTSALVKFYIDEVHSEQTLRLASQADHLICHAIGFVETRAALASATRGRRLTQNQHTQIVRQFREDWEKISSVGLDPELLERAAQFAEGFSLRGYDSLHLASADRIYKGSSEFVFISFDKRLNQAGRLLGMTLPDFIAPEAGLTE
ncbi:MAG TPA: PIN domain-containing protein [Gammaproteobacteria bacterium]|nr:PIN domain-containing protein [Gammaproteobacteria bacterium]